MMFIYKHCVGNEVFLSMIHKPHTRYGVKGLKYAVNICLVTSLEDECGGSTNEKLALTNKSQCSHTTTLHTKEDIVYSATTFGMG